MRQLSDQGGKEKKDQPQHEQDGINRQDCRQVMSEDRESARPKLQTMQAALGQANLEGSTVADKFWDLYQARGEIRARVS